jgi:hypothetical protein
VSGPVTWFIINEIMVPIEGKMAINWLFYRDCNLILIWLLEESLKPKTDKEKLYMLWPLTFRL